MPTSPVYSRPGVYVTEQLIGPSPAPLSASPSTCGFAGEHWRGPVGRAIQCNSWADFVKYYGGFQTLNTPVLTNPYLPFAVYMYFINGGQTAWINRIASSITPGTTASLTLKDNSATPQNTLSLTAGVLGRSGNPGTWGNQLFVDVVANTVAPGHFNITIYSGGYGTQFIVENWVDMTMNNNDARYVVQVLNSPQSGSVFVVATDLGDAATPPNDAPAGILGAQFSGGVDAASPSTTDKVAAVTVGTSPYDAVPNVLNFNLPGETTALVLTAAITYATSPGGRPYTFLFMDPPAGQTPAGAISYFNSLGPVSSYAAMYYPWLHATDPSAGNLRTQILLPPSGFVMGQAVTMDTNQGVWWAPAGMTTDLGGVVQSERQFTPGDLGTLNLANVNALRTLPQGQVVIWGTRTMQQGYASLYVPIRRTLNYIEASLAMLLEYIVFAPNDSLTWTNVTSTCTSFLTTLYTQHAFPGTTPATSFYVICDATNNPESKIDQGILSVTVGLALLYPAEFIALTIQQFQSTGATTITTTQAQ